MGSNVRRVPSCFPCGYAGQFGPTECISCVRNDVNLKGGGKRMSVSGMAALEQKPKPTPQRQQSWRDIPVPSAWDKPSTKYKAAIIVVPWLVLMLLIVISQVSTCSRVSYEDAGRIQASDMRVYEGSIHGE